MPRKVTAPRPIPVPPPLALPERRATRVKKDEDTIQLHVHHLIQVLADAAQKAQTPPGVAVMAACEFLALMLHTNVEAERHERELTLFLGYIRQRITSLQSPCPPSTTSQTPRSKRKPTP